jgi:uracil-DNA glycosylase family 4
VWAGLDCRGAHCARPPLVILLTQNTSPREHGQTERRSCVRGVGRSANIGEYAVSSNVKMPAATKLPTRTADLTILQALHLNIAGCALCPRLRAYGENIGQVRRRAYIDQEYWAKPVPGFGDEKARILVLGLAPGAHGANRTGRPFTGDGSGDFMYPVLHELGLASKPKAVSRDDGLRLKHLWIGSVVRCAPPGDKPAPEEVRNCAAHLTAEVAALPRVKVVVCLGKIAWDGYLAHMLNAGVIERRSAYTFSHEAEYTLPNGMKLLGSYHPSLRNTNTGRLNRVMFMRVFVRARELAGLR